MFAGVLCRRTFSSSGWVAPTPVLIQRMADGRGVLGLGTVFTMLKVKVLMSTSLRRRASTKVFVGMTDKAHSQDRQRTGSVACRNKVRHYRQPDILIDRQRVQKLA